MRAAWVWHETDPDWSKVDRYGIGILYQAASDSELALLRRLAAIRARSKQAGIYVAWNWGGWGDNPEMLAERMSALVGKVPNRTNSYPKVQFDIEVHDPDYVLRCLRRWRELRPNQDTSWTLESFQGGWMSVEFVEDVIELRTRVVPQAYTGTMVRQAEDMALRDLTRRGFPESLVTVMYDGRQLPANWDGFIYYLDRLP